MVLKTQRLILETMDIELMDAIIENNYKKIEKLGYRKNEEWPEEDLKEAMPVFKELILASGLNGFNNWIIVSKESSIIIGSAGFIGNPNQEGIVEVGFGIIPSMRNRGYCTEAVEALLQWGVKQENVTKIIAHCNEDNEKSIAALKKLNFRQVNCKDGLIDWVYCA